MRSRRKTCGLRFASAPRTTYLQLQANRVLLSTSSEHHTNQAFHDVPVSRATAFGLTTVQSTYLPVGCGHCQTPRKHACSLPVREFPTSRHPAVPGAGFFCLFDEPYRRRPTTRPNPTGGSSRRTGSSRQSCCCRCTPGTISGLYRHGNGDQIPSLIL